MPAWCNKYDYATFQRTKNVKMTFCRTAIKFLVLSLFVVYAFVSVAQTSESFVLNWNKPIQYGLEGGTQGFVLNFDRAQYDVSENSLPYFVIHITKSQNYVLKNVQFLNQRFEPLTEEERKFVQSGSISNEIKLNLYNVTRKRKNVAYIKLVPLREKNGIIEKLVAFDINYDFAPPLSYGRTKSMTFASESKLKDGDWYKIGVTKKALFKLDYEFLKQLGIDVDGINPRNLSLYGYGGGMLPEANSEERPDDLMENAITVIGEEDGSFDKSDYVVFYGEDQVEWRYDEVNESFRHELNRFSDTTYYFLNVGQVEGKRIRKESEIAEVPTYTTTSYDAIAFHELDQVNLIHSGRLWLGESFDAQLNRNFAFNIADIQPGQLGKVELSVFARSGLNSTFKLSTGSQSFSSLVTPVNLTRYWDDFARHSRSFFEFNTVEGPLSFNLQYEKPQTVAKGWLNSITVNVRSNLNFQSGHLFFRDINSIDNDNDYAEYLITTQKEIKVWDLTDKFNIVEKFVSANGSIKEIKGEAIDLREFVAFEGYNEAEINVIPLGKIENQNLHGLPQADLIVITHPLFKNQADRLADIHRTEGLRVHVVEPQQIYNEFSSGSQDLVAIRSFIKMFYDRAASEKDMPKYVTIIGDASYDYKDRLSNNTNFVPSFESRNSFDPISSYVSDHYFGMLDDNEGEWLPDPSSGEMADVAVGRLPVKNVQEAEGVVEKIIKYSNSSSMGDWRNKIVFVADDEDGVTHMSQSNSLTEIVDVKGKEYNSRKIFLDAYQQISTAGGTRYPGANKDLNQEVQNGALIVNYTGHGGETGWTAERVLGIADITAWSNLNRLPVFVTATCEFSRFDDPLRTSGGELTLLNEKGGSIGLMTTTRLVFSTPNYLLNRVFYDKMFISNDDNSVKRLGDIFLEVKNANSHSLNSRNFSLLGDAALKMAIPELKVVTTAINGKPIGEIDTLRALSKVTISGYVADHDGVRVKDYSGTIYPTVYDKVNEKRTLNNDGGGVFPYSERDSKIFKGKASVKKGSFSFSFVVPKDISYNFGKGKVLYYAENGSIDANGYSENVVIGGSDNSSIVDEQGPNMDVFMNDRNFVQGGITSSSPILLVELFDEQGINTVGGSIGHDLVAIIDGETDKAIILNDFFEAEKDSYQRGLVRFPFADLSEGKHTITVKAWDVANNSSEKTIEFTVLEEKQVEIKNLLNYPNPFTTSTEFIFQHNQAGVPLDVKLEVFTVSGKLVKSFDRIVVNEGFTSRDIRWNGKDDFGDKIGKGVYVYKLKVRSRNGSITEKVEKLVIL